MTNPLRENDAKMKDLLLSRGYNIKSVFSMYLKDTVLTVIKGNSDDLRKVQRDFSKIKEIHSIEIVEEYCYDDYDFCDFNFEAPIVDVLKYQVNYTN